MMRYLIATVFVASTVFSTKVHAQTTPDYFQVIFDGIVLHAFPTDFQGNVVLNMPNPRALIIEGNALTKRHYPTLIIRNPDVDVAALRDATGQPVRCNPTECRVAITRFAMRIGLENGDPVPDPLTVDHSFRILTPHMAGITNGGGMKGNVINDLPEAPVAGFFELFGGTLSACPFSSRAFFSPDYDNEGTRFFTRLVMLNGHVSAGAAVLQIKSYSSGKWQTVTRHNATSPLDIVVMNHSHAKTPTSTHFVLNGKIVLTKDNFPVVCAATATDQFCVDAMKKLTPRTPDQSDMAYFPEQKLEEIHPCDPPITAEAMISMATKMAAPIANASAQGGFLEATAGCANTQWP